ncbi:DUF4142 domain-containing protein [Chondromyces crocatus]|uniref:DUF4142 domain-containing protein n=1 Tax=Chondromyces crocatus TaxID=52 RepID=A0A0K1ENI4_CHOCO|nr:DUF4142 domain-containing protein [Chondromyces crocatus]AKT42153.1 uncharacterized protein CMC5_063760 [Chondromyces crocatus]
MRRVWMLAALALMAGCDPGNRGDVVAAERPSAVAPGQGQKGGVMVDGATMDSEPLATARLLAATQALAQTEVEKAKLALEKGTTEEVRKFAQALIDDHKRQLDKIGELAKDKKLDVQGMSLSDAQVRAQTEAGKQTLSMLQGMEGVSFDAAFMASQPTDHILLEHIGEQGQRVSRDPDLDYFFSDVMARAQAHRESAIRITPEACGGAPPGLPGQVTTTIPGAHGGTPGQVPGAAKPDPAARAAQPGGGSMQTGPRQGARGGEDGARPVTRDDARKTEP